MRKNYFAKKFVAYSMAFAVAFSTLTVSPVFVKEAKAAQHYISTTTYDSVPATADKFDGTILVGPAYTNDSNGSEKTLTAFKSFAGFATTDQIIGELKATNQISINNGAAFPNNANNLKEREVAFNNVVRDENADLGTPAKIGNKSFNYESTIADAEWFKLVAKEKEGTHSYNNISEKVKVPYYVLTSIKANVLSANDTEVGTLDTYNAETVYYTYSGSSYNQKPKSDLALEIAKIAGIVDAGVDDTFTADYEDKLGYTLYTDSNATVAVNPASDNYALTTPYYKKVNNTGVAVDKEELAIKIAQIAGIIDSNAKFKTGYDGATKLNGKLYKDNKDVLSLGDVNSDQLGMYVAVKGQAVVDSFLLKEVPDMKVKANQSSVKSVVGATVTLGVDATSSRELTYTWTRNGKELGNASTLKLENLTDKDFGTYSCKVTDGLASETVSIGLVKTTVSVADTAKDAATHITTYKNVLVGNNIPSTDGITVETSIPANDQFVYIWSYNGASASTLMPNSAKVNYDASNRSIVITNDNFNKTTCDTINVKAVLKTAYEKALKDELSEVSKAATYDKITKVDDLLTAENGLLATANVLFEEDIKLQADTEKDISEVKVMKLGDTLTLKAPLVPGQITGTPTYTWDDTNSTKTDTMRINTLGIGDFRTYTCRVEGTAGTPYDYTVNVVYVSDFTASADEIVYAKEGATDVKFTVSASSTLPITYTWTKENGIGATINETVTFGTASEVNSISLTKVAAGDFGKLDSYGKVDTSDNYIKCVVTDGISAREFYFAVIQEVGFIVKEGDKVLNNNDTVKLLARENTNCTLTPTVELVKSSSVTYNWTKTGSTTVLSTEPSYTFEFEGGTPRYTVKISDGVEEKNIIYNVSELTISDINKYDTVAEDVVYDGTAHINNIKVYAINEDTNPDSKFELVKDKDYTVEAKENINVGTARYEIKLIGEFANVVPTPNDKLSGTFFIDRADNELKVADKVVAVGGSVQPKTTNKAGAAVTYTYYTDEACTTAIEGVPTKVGVYYVKATAIATTNYNEATSNVAKVVIAPAKPKIGNTSRTASSITLNWAKTTGATAYRVYIKKNGKFTKVANTTGLKYTVTGLASATTYEFAVKAFVNGVASPVYSVRPTTTAPAKVSTPVVTAKGSGKVAISYGKVTRATGYQVYMAKGNGSYKKVAQGKLTAITKSKLTKGATYKFKVRAYKKVGSNVYYGAFSSAKAVKVK